MNNEEKSPQEKINDKLFKIYTTVNAMLMSDNVLLECMRRNPPINIEQQKYSMIAKYV
jgi:hypothetical protein